MAHVLSVGVRPRGRPCPSVRDREPRSRRCELDPSTIGWLVRFLATYAGFDVRAGRRLDDVEMLPKYAYGHVFALEHVWSDLAVADIVRDLAVDQRFRLDIVEVINAIVFQRVLDPDSESSLVRSFLPSANGPEFGGVALQHVSRACCSYWGPAPNSKPGSRV